MELLEQCQKWNENSEFQKIINILEAVPAGKRTPELDSELARAYNNLAQPWDRGLFEKASALSSAPSPASPSIRRGGSVSGTSLAPSRSSTHPTHLTRSSHIW